MISIKLFLVNGNVLFIELENFFKKCEVILKPAIISCLFVFSSEIKKLGSISNLFFQGFPASKLTAQPDLGETYFKLSVLLLITHFLSCKPNPICCNKNNSHLTYSSIQLDFDDIKDNLKSFLKSQTEFSDYNFEGSGLAVLIELLAYNTHYNGMLAHMVSNENFIDTAVKRESVVFFP